MQPTTRRPLAPPVLAALLALGAAGCTEPAPAEDPAEGPSIAFLGDSLTVGVGAPSGRGFAWQTAERLGWPIAVVDGVSGSGFLAPGGQGAPLPDRADAVIAAGPDVVLVAGGSNDAFGGYPADQVGAAAERLFDALEEGLPDALVVALGPFPGSPQTVAHPDPVRDAVESAAAEAGVPFLDPRDLLAETFADPAAWEAYVSEDGLHPNEQGYAVIADALAPRLAELADAP